MSGTHGSLLYILFLFISQSGTKCNPFFLTANKTEVLSYLFALGQLTKGPRGQAIRPSWLEQA